MHPARGKALNKRASAASGPAQKTGLWRPIGVRTHLALVVALGVVALVTFSNTLQNTGFALDNKFIILEDPRLHEATAANVRLIFTQDYWWPKAVSGLYRPLTTLSYLFNYAILQENANSTGYHWVNVLLHWANAILVYFMVLVLTELLWPAFFTAALFATHPIVTESVTNIVGRSDLFATTAIVGSLLCYIKSARVTGWRKAPWLLLLMVITALGVFFKESAVMVLGVMVLYDLTCRLRRLHANTLVNLLGNVWQFFLKGYIAVLPPLAAIVFVRAWLFGKMRPPEFPFVDNPLVSVAAEHGGNYYNLPFHNSLQNWLVCTLTGIKVIGRYFWLLLWPQTLSPDYSYDQIPLVGLEFKHFGDWEAVLALVVVLAALAAAARQYRRNKAVFFFVGFFFLTLLPTSNLLLVTGSIMAERFLYLPSIGFAGCVVIAVHALAHRIIPRLNLSARVPWMSSQVIAGSLLSLIVLACGARAYIRNFDWHDDIALWSAAVKVCPDSFKTHKSLALAFYERYTEHPPPDSTDIDRAIVEGEKARAVLEKKIVLPRFQTGIVYLHLGAYYRLKGELIAQHASGDTQLLLTPEAAPWYDKSIEALTRAIAPDRGFNDDLHRKELARGRSPDEIPDVGNPEIYSNLGLSYLRLGQYQQALNAYRYMQHVSPTDINAYMSIGSVSALAGQTTDAIVTFVQVLLLDKSRTDALRAVVSLYRQADPNGCALTSVVAQSLPALNRDCPLVRDHICAAYRGLVQVFLDAKQEELARRMKKNALIGRPSCPREGFDRVLPD